MFRHTKLRYDPALDYPAICHAVYGENKHLCVLEKVDVNAHVHCQGITNLTQREYDEKFTDLTANHYLRKQKTNARPVRHERQGKVDETGFQYMCKEDPPKVLSKNGFSDEDIRALHEQSEEHVAELKCGLKRKLHELSPESSPQEMHLQYQEEGLAYYESIDKMPPPNYQKLVLWAMYTSPGASTSVKRYVATRI